jgi:hypothetical protein
MYWCKNASYRCRDTGAGDYSGESETTECTTSEGSDCCNVGRKQVGRRKAGSEECRDVSHMSTTMVRREATRRKVLKCKSEYKLIIVVRNKCVEKFDRYWHNELVEIVIATQEPRKGFGFVTCNRELAGTEFIPKSVVLP